MLLPLWLQQWLLLLCHTLTLWLMLPITQAVSTVLGLLFHVLRTTRIRHRYYTQDYTGQHWKTNTTKNNNTKLQHDNIATLQDSNISTLQDYNITTLQPGNREDKSTKDC